MPGRHFESPGDFNAQFSDWLAGANARVVRTIKARPVDLLAADKEAMLALPPAVLHLGWRNHVRLGRDYFVRVDTGDYSVDPRAICARVDVAADPGHRPRRRRRPAGPPGAVRHRHRLGRPPQRSA